LLRVAALRNWLSSAPQRPLRERVIEAIKRIASTGDVRSVIGGP